MISHSLKLNVNGTERNVEFSIEFEYDPYDRHERPRRIIYLESVDGIEYASLDADVSDDSTEALYDATKEGTALYREYLDNDTEKAVDAYERHHGHFPY